MGASSSGGIPLPLCHLHREISSSELHRQKIEASVSFCCSSPAIPAMLQTKGRNASKTIPAKCSTGNRTNGWQQTKRQGLWTWINKTRSQKWQRIRWQWNINLYLDFNFPTNRSLYGGPFCTPPRPPRPPPRFSRASHGKTWPGTGQANGCVVGTATTWQTVARMHWASFLRPPTASNIYTCSLVSPFRFVRSHLLCHLCIFIYIMYCFLATFMLMTPQQVSGKLMTVWVEERWNCVEVLAVVLFLKYEPPSTTDCFLLH